MRNIMSPKAPFKAHSDDRYDVTHDLYLAAYLFAHGLWLSNAEQDASGRYRFAFRETAELEMLVRQFRRGSTALVDARTFAYALEELRRRAQQLQVEVSYDE